MSSTVSQTFPQSDSNTQAQVWYLTGPQQTFILTVRPSQASVRVELNGALHTEPGYFVVLTDGRVVLTKTALAGDTIRISYTPLLR